MKVKRKKLKPKNHLLFNQVIRLLITEFSPMYIYHYATVESNYHARSIFCDQDKRVQCTVHLLMITSGTESLESKVQDYIDRHAVGIKVVIQVHGDEIVCRNLNSSNGYFTSVVNTGKLIHVEQGEFPYAHCQPPNPRKQLARDIARWHKRYENAKIFLLAGRQSIDNGTDSIGIFLLHQATEQALVGLIYVFMGYRSDIRNLGRLLHVCACFSSQPLLHFTGAKDHESLLRVMIRAFNRARYQDEFSLEGHSGSQFLELVENFLKLANGLCNENFSTKQKAIDHLALAKKEDINE